MRAKICPPRERMYPGSMIAAAGITDAGYNTLHLFLN
jgi:hypothetical protein